MRVRGSDDGVYIAISDTGPGMSAEALTHVFDAYWRGETALPGVGLGLNVSRKLAELLGGEITVESEIGVGTTFTLRLPTE